LKYGHGFTPYPSWPKPPNLTGGHDRLLFPVLARQDQECSRLMTVPGIGPIVSIIMMAVISPQAANSPHLARAGVCTNQRHDSQVSRAPASRMAFCLRCRARWRAFHLAGLPTRPQSPNRTGGHDRLFSPFPVLARQNQACSRLTPRLASGRPRIEHHDGGDRHQPYSQRAGYRAEPSSATPPVTATAGFRAGDECSCPISRPLVT
jgi:hypothetical protein